MNSHTRLMILCNILAIEDGYRQSGVTARAGNHGRESE